MKMYLLTEGARFPLRLPHEAADHALCSGTCPKCGLTGFGVQGSGRRPSVDDRAWEADAYCATCKASVGTIRVEPNTLFGVCEDEAVLSGRCRVY
jgi:hypothetical protein